MVFGKDFIISVGNDVSHNAAVHIVLEYAAYLQLIDLACRLGVFYLVADFDA